MSGLVKIPSYILDQSYMRQRRKKRRENIIHALKDIAFLVFVFIVLYAVLYAWGGK